MPDPTDWQLIDRYLAGEASPDEIAVVRTRAATDPDWAKALDALHADFARRSPPAHDTDLAWSRLQSRLASQPDISQASRTLHAEKNHSSRAARSTPWLRIAAAVLVAAGSFATWQMISARRGSAPHTPTFANDIVTPNGTRQTITLGDGSRVTLNAASRLRWAKDFGTTSRDVYLDGEGYFVVTHDPARPFRVHTREAVAHDLGTRFTVRAYPELPQVEVVVAEGMVSLRHDRPSADSAILRVGQRGRLGPSGPPTVESNVAVDRWTAWTSGAIVLDGLTLAEAVPQLERWYDVTITVPDTLLARRRIAARFHDESLPQMLDALTFALGARWQQAGRTVTLSPGAR